MTTEPLTPEEEAEWRGRLAMGFASLFIRIRGAHNPDPGEPCAWCQLAADQAAEAVVQMATGIGMDGRLRGLLDAARQPSGDLAAALDALSRDVDSAPDYIQVAAVDIRDWLRERPALRTAPPPGAAGLEVRIRALVDEWSEDDAVAWIDGVPRLTRTQVVARLRAALAQPDTAGDETP